MKEANEAPNFTQQFYPFLHPQETVSLEKVLADVKTSTLQKCADVVALRTKVLQENGDEIARCGEALAKRFADGARLLAFGNGGSATDAQDLAADCVLRGLPAISLTNDIAVVTAVANDVGFENVFRRQIIAFGREGDIAFGISTSGNSRNIEMAFEMAHKMKLMTVGLSGNEGGKTAELHRAGVVDFCFTAPLDYIPRIQEAHATIYHTLIELARNKKEHS